MFLSLVPPSSFSEVVIPRLRTTVPQKSHPSIAHNRPPIESSLIFVRIRPPKSHPSIAKQSSRDLRISLFLSQHSVFFLLLYRNIFSLPVTAQRFPPPVIPQHFFSSVTPACFFICHSGLRAGVQVNIDSLAAWIPGQARNDSKKQARNDKRKQKKLVDPLTFFLMKKRGATVIG